MNPPVQNLPAPDDGPPTTPEQGSVRDGTNTQSSTSRRQLLGAGLALAGGWMLNSCSPVGSPPRALERPSPPPIPRTGPAPGRTVIEKTLRAAPATLDLGGVQADAWVYNDTLPGLELRAKPGDLLRITLDNQLPAATTLHWHGVAVANGLDGVADMTQSPVEPGDRYPYEFAVPHPGTYFVSSHAGLQLDRGLYAPLIVEDPAEPGAYDAEWVVVLDDWLTADGRTPEDLFQALTTGSPRTRGRQDGLALSALGPHFGDAGDIAYPHYLINGAIASAPVAHLGKPGQRVRIRVINAASDTIFALALAGHRMKITHADGFPVKPHETSALYLGMGERYDVVVTLGDGVYPLVAKPWRKRTQALALIRTGRGSVPPPHVQLAEFRGVITQASDLQPAESSRLPDRPIDVTASLELGGQASPYRWTINGSPYGQNDPIEVMEGQRLEVTVVNATRRAHPLHIHGHTTALPSGLRKDTTLIPAMSTTALQLQANNPGRWAIHCQNDYHTQAGMMLELQYWRS